MIRVKAGFPPLRTEGGCSPDFIAKLADYPVAFPCVGVYNAARLP